MSPPPPPLALGTPTAHLFSLLFSLTYVGSLYISKHSRLSFSTTTTHSNKGERQNNDNDNQGEREKKQSERWRDDPDVIRARLLAVLCTTTVCCSVLLGVVWADLEFRWEVRLRFHHLFIPCHEAN
jgi:prenyl protein peptidase